MRGLCGHDVGPRAGAGIGVTGRVKPMEILLVDSSSPALAVGAVWPDVGCAPFVIVESEPLEVVLDEPGIFGLGALRVVVFDADQPAESGRASARAHRQP